MTTRTHFILLLAGVFTVFLNQAPHATAQTATGFEHAISVSASGLSPINLEFGQATGAMDAYDADVDVVAPPAPPFGFDARISQQGGSPATEYYRDIRSVKDTETYTVVITPKSTEEPAVNVTWEALPEFSGTLTLEMGGNTVDLVQGGSLALTLANGLPQSGVITYSSGVTTSTESTLDLTASSLLKSAYPNPTRSSTSIQYELDREGAITLAIYDMLGRQVALLDESWKPAGTHEARWDGAGRISSGTYFIVLRAGENLTSQPLVVID